MDLSWVHEISKEVSTQIFIFLHFILSFIQLCTEENVITWMWTVFKISIPSLCNMFTIFQHIIFFFNIFLHGNVSVCKSLIFVWNFLVSFFVYCWKTFNFHAHKTPPIFSGLLFPMLLLMVVILYFLFCMFHLILLSAYSV